LFTYNLLTAKARKEDAKVSWTLCLFASHMFGSPRNHEEDTKGFFFVILRALCGETNRLAIINSQTSTKLNQFLRLFAVNKPFWTEI